jgi:hypothetical protein
VRPAKVLTPKQKRILTKILKATRTDRALNSSPNCSSFKLLRELNLDHLREDIPAAKKERMRWSHAGDISRYLFRDDLPPGPWDFRLKEGQVYKDSYYS